MCIFSRNKTFTAIGVKFKFFFRMKCRNLMLISSVRHCTSVASVREISGISNLFFFSSAHFHHCLWSLFMWLRLNSSIAGFVIDRCCSSLWRFKLKSEKNIRTRSKDGAGESRTLWKKIYARVVTLTYAKLQPFSLSLCVQVMEHLSSGPEYNYQLNKRYTSYI